MVRLVTVHAESLQVAWIIGAAVPPGQAMVRLQVPATDLKLGCRDPALLAVMAAMFGDKGGQFGATEPRLPPAGALAAAVVARLGDPLQVAAAGGAAGLLMVRRLGGLHQGLVAAAAARARARRSHGMGRMSSGGTTASTPVGGRSHRAAAGWTLGSDGVQDASSAQLQVELEVIGANRVPIG